VGGHRWLGKEVKDKEAMLKEYLWIKCRANILKGKCSKSRS
jgi:hypothetical protein